MTRIQTIVFIINWLFVVHLWTKWAIFKTFLQVCSLQMAFCLIWFAIFHYCWPLLSQGQPFYLKLLSETHTAHSQTNTEHSVSHPTSRPLYSYCERFEKHLQQNIFSSTSHWLFFFFLFLLDAYFLSPMLPHSSTQPSVTITRTEEPPCHPGVRRAQPCGHQRHLRQHGLLRPGAHRHPQETAEPHGGRSLWRSWYWALLMCFVFKW